MVLGVKCAGREYEAGLNVDGSDEGSLELWTAANMKKWD